MLLTDGFGGFGGIATFNADFLRALDLSSAVERVNALPRLISEPIVGLTPECVVYDRAAACGKVNFLKRLWIHRWRTDCVNLVISGHINLLPAASLFARSSGARLGLVIYGIDAWEPPKTVLGKRLLGTVDTVLSVSRYTAERFSSWSGVASDKAFILHPCVDLDRFKPGGKNPTLIAKYDLALSKVIMTVGRLAPHERYKGFDEVMEVMPRLLIRHPGLKYLIVGDGLDRARLESKAKTLGLATNVIFAGKIPESEKVDYFNLADAYVMPSYGEGFGIVFLEAAACGVPVIGSLADASQEALLGGRLGRLVDPRSSDDLYHAISQTLEAAAPHARNDLVAEFSRARFNERVHLWLESQRRAAVVVRDQRQLTRA